jgi:hypothetical protein
MAELIDNSSIFFSSFEPKVQNRFIMYIDGIPAYMIKASGRPSINNNPITLDHINLKRYIKGKSEWNTIEIQMYDPVVPSAAQAAMEWVRLSHESITGRDGYADFYKKDVVINVLGPVGDIVESWTLKGCFPAEVNFNSMDWATADPLMVTATLRYDYAILQF